MHRKIPIGLYIGKSWCTFLEGLNFIIWGKGLRGIGIMEQSTGGVERSD